MENNKNFRLSLKISGTLGLIIFLFIFVYLIIYTNHYQKYEDRVIGQENINTLHSIDSSISMVIESADNYSKMILADSVVQQQMEIGNIVSDFSRQQTLIKRIYSVLQFSEFIDMICLIDEQGQRLIVGDSANVYTGNAEEYEELKKPYGEAQIVIDKGKNENYLMLSRSFNSLESFSILGLIGVQINNRKLEELIQGSIASEEQQIAILSEDNEVIYWNGGQFSFQEVLKAAKELENSKGELLKKEKSRYGQAHYLSGITNEEGWKIVRYSPVLKAEHISDDVRFNIILIIIIGALIFMVSAVISNMLTRPIQMLLNKMKNVENRELSQVVGHAYLREFRELFNGYNKMVEEIKRLIQEILERQRRIRIVEMNELQELMKPHFLYNTLDSIEALILLGDMENSAKLTGSLGNFYRKSVSGGKEFLTLREEMQIVADYTNILKMRFGETFKFDMRFDENCLDYKIPKLTIQPLVENAFQHGIRAQNKYGYIQVNIKEEGAQIHVSVCDNGKGIPDSVIKELSEGTVCSENKSLGLRGTIQRLNLLYETAFRFEISSRGMSEVHLYFDRAALREKEEWIS